MKKIIYLFFGLFIFSLLGCSNSTNSTSKEPDSEKIIDILLIAGKPLKEVEKVLGKSQFVEKIKDRKANCGDCPKYSFDSGKVNIVFINGISDWITINDGLV
jgi:hypothetical protein